jgi:uncharacterized protein (TIGR00251 family)
LKFKDGKSGAVIRVNVRPRSSVASINGIMEDGSIKIRLTSAPVEGQANDELLSLLAKSLGVKKGNLEIILGQSSKKKMIAVYGLDADKVNQIIHSIVEEKS